MSDTTFQELYCSYWPTFANYHRSREGLSAPLLVDPPADYFLQKPRLFVVGQETRGWNDVPVTSDPKAVADLMALYRAFAMGLGRKRDVFWQFIRRLEGGLGITRGAVVWSNLNKVDQRGKRPSEEVSRELLEQFPVLADEIRLAAPDLVVFFTGRGNDNFLQSALPGVVFESLGKDVRWIARLAHPEYWGGKWLRTYHPRFLKTGGLWNKTLAEITAFWKD